MELTDFQSSLLHELSSLEDIQDVDIRTEVFILKGRVMFQQDSFLQIYFNQQTGTTAFAFVENAERIWGIDFDNFRGWHIHPFDNAEFHVKTEPKTVKQIIELFKEVLNSRKFRREGSK